MFPDNPTIGWLGTGRMGAAMATRLLEAGERVHLWNRTRAKAEALAPRGAIVHDSIADLAAACDIVFIMVSTPADLREVVSGDRGLLAAAERRVSVVVDCSTVSEEASAAVRAEAESAGAAFLACPISGNPHVVAEGGSCLVASGPRATFELVEPYLLRIAKLAVYAGPGEQSRLVKLCHNLYLGMMVQALAEVTSLAEKGGVQRQAFLDFLNGTVVTSEWVRKRTPDLVGLDWTPTFTTELLRKDFDLGLASARDLRVPMLLGAAVHQLIQVVIAHGHGSDDFLSMYAVQAEAAGIDLQPETG